MQGPADNTVSDRPPEFSVSSEMTGRSMLVSVRGELDMATVPQLERALQDAEADPARGVALDLSEVTFLDSTALRALLQSTERLNESGRKLQIACPPGPVRSLFEMTVLTPVFGMHPTRDEALAAAGD